MVAMQCLPGRASVGGVEGAGSGHYRSADGEAPLLLDHQRFDAVTRVLRDGWAAKAERDSDQSHQNTQGISHRHIESHAVRGPFVDSLSRWLGLAWLRGLLDHIQSRFLG